jgi:hypothetical protein
VVRRELASFFKPSKWTVIFLALLILVALFGQAQTYAFTCGGSGYKCEGTGIEKPLLYDVAGNCPCWEIWVISSFPLFPLTTAIRNGLDIGENELYLFFAINFVYYYVVLRVLEFFGQKAKQIRWFDDPPRQVKS